ncbi:hypothetical protein CC2G_014446 [Coprinopsis cinerea AmutBmut pab1-1]|nr:hypothetical protein CC2G_014446 [Coprinopsis cinerea AmutBmut pab1-1]
MPRKRKGVLSSVDVEEYPAWTPPSQGSRLEEHANIELGAVGEAPECSQTFISIPPSPVKRGRDNNAPSLVDSPLAGFPSVDAEESRSVTIDCGDHAGENTVPLDDSGRVKKPRHFAEWNGAFFERTSLKNMGSRIQLGHPLHDPCPRPARAFNDEFVVVASDGIHSVGLDFCGCTGAPSHFVQLLRAGLFPATTNDPRTAASFDVLRTFQMLSFTSKISAFEFYNALKRRSDNTGTEKIPDRYNAFLRMVHVFRHVRLLKRTGRGHDPGGSWGTAPGECAVLCPACPYPGINLPEGWEKTSKEERYIYQLFLALDANFRLRRKDVSSDEKDPGLNKGYAYIVEENQFKAHLRQYGKTFEDDKSSCNNHDAIKSASSRGGKGTAASGMGTAQCSRHEMSRPLGLGDLQKGERTDGESPERTWAVSNELASSTREMGPGSRRDSIDDALGDRNWHKSVNLVDTLMDRAEEALVKRAEKVQAFVDFSAALETAPVEWTETVKAWESDPKKPNPYATTSTHMTANAVRLKLAEEEAEALKEGKSVSVHAVVTPSQFIVQGLDLEEAQRRLAHDTDALGPHSTDRQRTRVLERSNSIKRRIDAWVGLQSLFMPPVAAHREAVSGPAEETRDFTLFLPSSVCASMSVDPRLLECEQRLRVGQAETALHDLRVHLMLRSQLWKSKARYASGTRMLTRSNALIANVSDKLNSIAARYRSVRDAIVNLSLVTGDMSWEQSLKPLTDTDVRGLTADDEGLGEGHKQLTWIWTTAGVGASMGNHIKEELRVEWCKTRARAHRWQEECMLLQEEMRRVVAFWEWDAKRWETRADRCRKDESFVTPAPSAFNSVQVVWEAEVEKLNRIREGKIAYALRQAAIRRRIIDRCLKKWGDIRDRLATFNGKSGFALVEAA